MLSLSSDHSSDWILTDLYLDVTIDERLSPGKSRGYNFSLSISTPQANFELWNAFSFPGEVQTCRASIAPRPLSPLLTPYMASGHTSHN